MYWRRDCPQAFKYLEILRRAEFEDSRLIEMRQWESLQKILKHAGQNVPYYRDLFKNMGIRPEDIRTPGDLERIPLLTKDLLQQHTSQLLQTAGEEGNRLPNASGGSTGKPVRFYQDTFYWTFARASQWFAEGWWGIQPGDRIASIWGCDRDLPDMTWKERLRLKIEQTRLCNAFAMSEESMEKFAQMMVRWKPRYVTGYASALEVFANFLLSRPDLVVRPHAVKSTAEALFSAQRVAIEKAFEAPLYNFYGSREVNNLAAECQAHEGLHINSLGRYIEIVDELGKAQPPGKPGRIVVTDLTNFAMPFIRYAIEDVGSWRGKPCSCGRPFPLLERVWGRSSDFIVAPGGKLIHGEFFTHLFYNIPGIDQFRVVQRTKSEVRVDIVMQPGVSSVQTDLLRSRIADVMGPNVNCEIQVVTSIERPASGKHRFTISEVPVPWKETSLENLEEAGPIQI
jgi:phenylacetate-CoA ligase